MDNLWQNILKRLDSLAGNQPQSTPQPEMRVTYGRTPDFKFATTDQMKPSGVPAPSKSDPQSSNIQWLEQNVLPITRRVGLPDALVAGQWAIEDRKKDTSMFNLRIGGKVHTYQNIENNVNDYIRTVTQILKSKGFDINHIKDPKQILRILQAGDYRYEGHSKDPQDYVKITAETPEYNYYAQSQ